MQDNVFINQLLYATRPPFYAMRKGMNGLQLHKLSYAKRFSPMTLSCAKDSLKCLTTHT